MLLTRPVVRYLLGLSFLIAFALFSPTRASAQCNNLTCMDDSGGQGCSGSLGPSGQDCEMIQGSCNQHCHYVQCIEELATRLKTTSDIGLRKYLQVGCSKASEVVKITPVSLKQSNSRGDNYLLIRTVRQFQDPAMIVSSIHGSDDLFMAGKLLNVGPDPIVAYRLDFMISKKNSPTKMVEGHWVTLAAQLNRRSIGNISRQHITYAPNGAVLIEFFVGAVRYANGSMWHAEPASISTAIATTQGGLVVSPPSSK